MSFISNKATVNMSHYSSQYSMLHTNKVVTMYDSK